MSSTISDLVERVEKGSLALPQFQRDYRWEASLIEDLFRSIIKNWPIGTLLLFDQSNSGKDAHSLQPRSIVGAPECQSHPDWLILDGQQRMTSIYQAVKGRHDAVFYLELEKILEANGFVDDAIGSVPRKSLEKKLGKPKERTERRFVLLEEIFDGEKWREWIEYIDRDDQKKFGSIREDHLRFLREHSVNVELVSNALPIEAVAKIFERTNRNVTKLDAFDLMVAILYPHKFKLRTKWEEAREKNEILVEMSVPPLEILKFLALLELFDQEDDGKASVSTITQSDILDLKPSVVKKRWAPAVESYVKALELMRDRWGVVRSQILPHSALVLPVAYLIQTGALPAKGAKLEKLDRWFWASIFSRQYSSQTNYRPVRDIKRLRIWLAGSGDLPHALNGFDIGEEDFLRIDEGHGVFVKGICCLLNTQGARGWTKVSEDIPPPEIVAIEENLEIHHIFPEKFLDKLPKAELRKLPPPNAPANQCLIEAARNQKLTNMPPEYALEDPLVDSRGVETHEIDLSLLHGKKFGKFAKDRAARLKTLVDKAVKGI